MFSPWQMQPPFPVMLMAAGLPLRKTPTGGFPVPESISPEDFPPAVKASIARLFEGPPKPAVTLAVMQQTQASMIAPDLPYRSNV